MIFFIKEIKTLKNKNKYKTCFVFLKQFETMIQQLWLTLTIYLCTQYVCLCSDLQPKKKKKRIAKRNQKQ